MRKLQYLLLGLLFITSSQLFSQVGINNATPDASAILDLKSDTSGLLIPRMLDFERRTLVAPANALFVYDQSQGMFFYYDSTYSTGSVNWTGLSPWRYIDQENELFTDETVRSVGIGTLNPNSDNALTIAGNVVIGDSTSTAPDNGLLVVGDVVAGSLMVSDTLRATTIVGKGSIPVGGIIVWSGDPSNLPDGWALCTGSVVNGVTTPDLRGRFIVGYDPTASSTPVTATNKEENYAQIGNTGGENAHTLSEDEMPVHDHDGVTGLDGDHDHTFTDNYKSSASVYRFDDYDSGSNSTTTTLDDTDPEGDHNHVIPVSGGDVSHENRPPYYVVAYIIRVK